MTAAAAARTARCCGAPATDMPRLASRCAQPLQYTEHLRLARHALSALKHYGGFAYKSPLHLYFLDA